MPTKVSRCPMELANTALTPKSEIRDLDLTLVVDEEVGGLDITVYNVPVLV